MQAAIKTINQNVSVFTVGEMLMGDPFRWATDYIARWVKDGAIGSAFNYPMVSTMRRTLRVSVPEGGRGLVLTSEGACRAKCFILYLILAGTCMTSSTAVLHAT